MRKEELYETVKRVWNDKNNLFALAMDYLAYHQIVCTMLEFKGGNYYLLKRKGLSLGTRKDFITTEDKEGVISVPDPPNETESIQL